jgi:hypothetical protein
MTNTRNQDVDNTLKVHGKAITDLQATLATLMQQQEKSMKQQEQSLKQQEEIIRAFKEQSKSGGSGGRGSGIFGSGGSGGGPFSDAESRGEPVLCE